MGGAVVVGAVGVVDGAVRGGKDIVVVVSG